MIKNPFKIISPAFKDGAAIPGPYTCMGQNVSPPLNIISPPDDTASLALIMHDPDSVRGDFTHWLVWDIPSSTETIPAHSLPVGAVQGRNDAGKTMYYGPCPTAGSGVHHYLFELYALDKMLCLPGGSGREQLSTAMRSHILAKDTLLGTFAADRYSA